MAFDDWGWGINQGNAIQQGRLAGENNELRKNLEKAIDIAAKLAEKLAEVQQAQADWKKTKEEYPTQAFWIDIECAVNPQLYSDAPLAEKRLANLKLWAWAEFWICLEQDSKYIRQKDAVKLKSLSESMMHMETLSAVRNAGRALEDVANRLELIGDPLFEDPHAWVNARVADMQTTVKWLNDDPTIPDPKTMDGQNGKPIILQDRENERREKTGDKNFVSNLFKSNAHGIGDVAVR